MLSIIISKGIMHLRRNTPQNMTHERRGCDTLAQTGDVAIISKGLKGNHNSARLACKSVLSLKGTENALFTTRISYDRQPLNRKLPQIPYPRITRKRYWSIVP